MDRALLQEDISFVQKEHGFPFVGALEDHGQLRFVVGLY